VVPPLGYITCPTKAAESLRARNATRGGDLLGAAYAPHAGFGGVARLYLLQRDVSVSGVVFELGRVDDAGATTFVMMPLSSEWGVTG
jgi:hypothetical protein